MKVIFEGGREEEEETCPVCRTWQCLVGLRDLMKPWTLMMSSCGVQEELRVLEEEEEHALHRCLHWQGTRKV